MKRFWMPLNIGDYLSETGHLTAAEHGAYLLLQMYYWNNSTLPADEDAIRRVSKLTPRQWLQSRNALKAFFVDGWRHLALDLKIREVIEKSEVNAANARKSHTNRKRFVPNKHADSQTQPKLQPESLPSGESNSLSPEVANNSEDRKNAASRLDPDWILTPADEKVAAYSYGMSPADIASELMKFRAHHAEKGSLSHDWSASWSKWCARWNGKAIPINPLIGDNASGRQLVHVKVDTPEWEAWQTYRKRTTGKGTPTDKNFGWYFDSRWPPEHPPLTPEVAGP